MPLRPSPQTSPNLTPPPTHTHRSPRTATLHLPSAPRSEAIGAPGMVVLQFAWGGGPGNVHLPHNHYENCFVYPGTHDNETAVGWFRGSANDTDKSYIKSYLRTDGGDIAWDFIRACMAAVPRTCVIMMQVGCGHPCRVQLGGRVWLSSSRSCRHTMTVHVRDVGGVCTAPHWWSRRLALCTAPHLCLWDTVTRLLNHAAPSCVPHCSTGRDAAGQHGSHEHARHGRRELALAHGRWQRVELAQEGGRGPAEGGTRHEPPAQAQGVNRLNERD